MRGDDTLQALLCLRGNDLAFIETENARLYIVDQHVALLEVKRGKTVDGKQSKQCLDLLERLISARYSIVINRNINERDQYLSIYEAIEDRRRLSKVAIVWGKLGIDCMEYGTEICKKKMSAFENMEDAISWARTIN